MLQKSISGGERKRTSIGVELITDPQIVLLDEPTSGLDSFTAIKIVRVLQVLAYKYGKTICATIHQPSSQAYSYFDRLILMGDGHILFQGKASDARDYFAQQGFVMHHHSNPADFFMRTLTFNHPKTEEDLAKLETLTKAYDATLRPAITAANKEVSCPDLDVRPDRKQMASFRTQFKMLMTRNRAILKREPQAWRAKVGSTVVFGLLELILFWQVGKDYSFTGLQDMAGALFFWCVILFMGNMFNIILIFQTERPVFLREQANQMYTIRAYYLAKNMIETPPALLVPTGYMLMMYWTVGFD